MTDEQSPKILDIKRIILRDLSFETPMGQDVFTRDWQPDYQVRLDLRSNRLDENLWEMILTATVTASLDSSVVFLIEAHQAGVFEIAEQETIPLRQLLWIDAPRFIFPYLRETVDSVATKGGFPIVGLQPPDFEAWHANALRPDASSGGESGDESGEGSGDDGRTRVSLLF